MLHVLYRRRREPTEVERRRSLTESTRPRGFDHAHAGFLGLDAGTEVPAPDELRSRIAPTVTERAERYGNSRTPGGG